MVMSFVLQVFIAMNPIDLNQEPAILAVSFYMISWSLDIPRQLRQVLFIYLSNGVNVSTNKVNKYLNDLNFYNKKALYSYSLKDW